MKITMYNVATRRMRPTGSRDLARLSFRRRPYARLRPLRLEEYVPHQPINSVTIQKRVCGSTGDVHQISATLSLQRIC